MAVPVLLVHGSRTSRTMWRAQLDALARAGIRAGAIDLPGHGTRLDEPFTLDDAVRTVTRGVDDLGGRACVVGLSLGGYVAIEHRARRPDQVASLLAASCCTVPSTRLRVAWLAASRRIEALPDRGAALNQALVERMLTPEGVRDVSAGGFALEVMSAVLREAAACDPLRSLAAASSPVWLVNGRWDHFRRHERDYLAAVRSGGGVGRIVVIPGARHLVSLDAPVAFNRVLLGAADPLRA